MGRWAALAIRQWGPYLNRLQRISGNCRDEFNADSPTDLLIDGCNIRISLRMRFGRGSSRSFSSKSFTIFPHWIIDNHWGTSQLAETECLRNDQS